MATIFDVKSGQFGRFDPKRAVAFFSDLLWAEARKLGVPSTRVHVCTNIYAKDGGVDATVDPGEDFGDSDLVRKGKTAFQIKTGEFQPHKKSTVRHELFSKTSARCANPSTLEFLKPEIKACLEAQDRYVVVAFGTKMTSAQNKKAIQLLIEFFSECGFQNPSVDVLGQDDLKGLVQSFPSLCLQINGYDGANVCSHHNWSLDADMDPTKKQFKAGPEQEQFIETLQGALADQSTQHIRVCGAAGIGKTRLVREATADAAISPSVLYFQSPSELTDSGILHVLLAVDSLLTAILVVDECAPDQRAELVRKFAARSDRIKVVSIYHEEDRATGVSLMPASLLPDEQINEIFQTYGISKDNAYRYVSFCGGIPRAAHDIASNLKNNPDDLLRPVSESRSWDRIIAGTGELDSPTVQERKVVLMYMALFRRFG